MNIKTMVLFSTLCFSSLNAALSVANENNPAPSCRYQKDYVDHQKTPESSDILTAKWISDVAPDSNEFRKTLFILYKNGDTATIEHKYCSIYNFEISYMAKDEQEKTLEHFSAVIQQLTQSAYFDLEFNPSVKLIIQQTLSKTFNKSKPQSIGLPYSKAESSTNESVEYSVSYTPLGDIGSSYSYIVNFYVGVGGMH
ncbi:MAG: hypothetical protein JKY01_09430 [Pseudomonadales bacterium]|nr:hypothetical protein [Pseudomonadales bacterium]